MTEKAPQTTTDELSDNSTTQSAESETGSKQRTFIEWAVFFITCCSLIVLVFEYFATQRENRIEKTFSLLEDWDELNYYDDYVRFGDLILDFERAAKEGESDSNNNDASTATRNYIQNSLSLVDPKDARTIERIYYYFSKLSICVKENICDRSMVNSFFGERMSNFRGWTDIYVLKRRESAKAFATDIDEHLSGK